MRGIMILAALGAGLVGCDEGATVNVAQSNEGVLVNVTQTNESAIEWGRRYDDTKRELTLLCISTTGGTCFFRVRDGGSDRSFAVKVGGYTLVWKVTPQAKVCGRGEATPSESCDREALEPQSS